MRGLGLGRVRPVERDQPLREDEAAERQRVLGDRRHRHHPLEDGHSGGANGLAVGCTPGDGHVDVVVAGRDRHGTLHDEPARWPADEHRVEVEILEGEDPEARQAVIPGSLQRLLGSLLLPARLLGLLAFARLIDDVSARPMLSAGPPTGISPR